MPPELIRFHGTYRYRSQRELEEAVVAARDALDDDDLTEPAFASLRCVVKHGVLLFVDIVLPAASGVQFAAVSVFESLAAGAVEGAVDATLRDRCVHTFASGSEDWRRLATRGGECISHDARWFGSP